MTYLEKGELQRIWDVVEQKWDAKTTDYWWPLRKGSAPRPAIAFHLDWFGEDKAAALCDVLVEHGVVLVWERGESREWGCHLSVHAFVPAYNGEEGYWTSEGAEWLVYASHEASITLAGEWLVRSFRGKFPDCDQFTYCGAMSTDDLRGQWWT